MNMMLEKYPLPWMLVAYDDHERGAFDIIASNGEKVMECADYSGDGAQIYLSTPQARELCALLNAGMAKP